MKVEELYYESHCDECDKFTTVYDIYIRDRAYPATRLCHECLMKLLVAIVEKK